MRSWHWACWFISGISGLTLMILGAANKQGMAKGWIPSWVLLILALVTIVALVAAIFTTRIDCPSCKEYAGNGYRGDLIGSRPLHARQDGQPDRRYKHNPIVQTFELKGRCTKCGHVWDRGTVTG